MEPIGTRIYFAGEAAHETLFGTLNGAWESGERAADAILRRYAPASAAKRPRKKKK
jgi:monoamine oxidase